MLLLGAKITAAAQSGFHAPGAIVYAANLQHTR